MAAETVVFQAISAAYFWIFFGRAFLGSQFFDGNQRFILLVKKLKKVLTSAEKGVIIIER